MPRTVASAAALNLVLAAVPHPDQPLDERRDVHPEVRAIGDGPPVDALLDLARPDQMADRAQRIIQVQEMRRQQASSIVIPDAGAASALAGQGGLPPLSEITVPTKASVIATFSEPKK